jgi:flagellar motor switch protein FliN/FliY
MARPNDSAPTLQWLASAWTECLSAVVEAAIGENPHFAYVGDAFTPSEGVAFTQPFSIGPDCAITVFFGRTSATTIGEAALASLGIEAADSDAARGTFLELVSQAANALAGRLGAETGREVVCQPAREELLLGAQLRAVQGKLGGVAIDHGFGVSSGLLAVLASRSNSAASAAAQDDERHRTLDLLLDVELPVSVSFGRARVALKDVLKFTSGSLVELNRSVSDPVEVIVNNCVIARGEVVVVDGNYGIRIQEILSRQERLRTLH